MPRLCLKPSSQLDRHCRKWVRPPPRALGLRLGYAGRAYLTLPPCSAQSREEFLSGLRTAWREGEVRPTSVAKAKPKRSRRRPDPFAAVTVELRGWFEAEPWHTSRELLERLQAQCPGVYPEGQLRTLQRRLKEWRREAAHQMVFGTTTAD